MYRPDFEVGLSATWNAIHVGIVDANTKKRKKYWKYWCQYATKCSVRSYLDRNGDDGLIILTGFIARVRKGYFGYGNQVCVQSVSDAIGAVSKTIEMI